MVKEGGEGGTFVGQILSLPGYQRVVCWDINLRFDGKHGISSINGIVVVFTRTYRNDATPLAVSML